MQENVLKNIGLSKNEADVYSAMVKIGASGVGDISKESKVHRRNVYDVLNRLLEKGLVYIILRGRKNRYQAVNPNKLIDLIGEQKNSLLAIMPNLDEMMKTDEKEEEIIIYQGIKGWKRYLRDIANIGKNVYTIGAQASWADERLKSTLEYFNSESVKKGFSIHLIYDYELKKQEASATSIFTNQKHAFFPEQYSSASAVDICGDYVAVVSNMGIGKIREDTFFTVIKNQEIADAFKIWFKLMWKFCSTDEIE